MSRLLTHSERIERQRTGGPSGDESFRSQSRRDRDRLRYTREFRRLKNVTQVARAQESSLFHDRLTHSLKVAQVGDALARILMQRKGVDPGQCGQPRQDVREPYFQAVDPFVVQTAAHAHDIGHPPFGHAIETFLDDLLTKKTKDLTRTIGFEGNAQSFRIITRLANHDGPDYGLDLTRASLNGTLKYPWSREENDSKWGYYPDDKEAFEFARDPLPDDLKDQKTLEAQIMDYADDLTYAVHDVADFYQAGLIPLDRLFLEATTDPDFTIKSRTELDGFIDYLEDADSFKFDPDSLEVGVEEFFRRLTEARQFEPVLYSRFNRTDEERVALNQFSSMLVGRFLEGRDLNGNPYVRVEEPIVNSPELDISTAAQQQIEVLKHLTRYYVITNANLMQQQQGQRRVISDLFEDLYKQAAPDTQPQSAIPSPFRDRLKKNEERGVPRVRFVADIITSMTERQAVALHRRLRGNTPRSLVSNILD